MVCAVAAIAPSSSAARSRAIQILLGHSKIENAVRYLGVYIEDALLLAERIRSGRAHRKRR